MAKTTLVSVPVFGLIVGGTNFSILALRFFYFTALLFVGTVAAVSDVATGTVYTLPFGIAALLGTALLAILQTTWRIAASDYLYLNHPQAVLLRCCREGGALPWILLVAYLDSWRFASEEVRGTFNAVSAHATAAVGTVAASAWAASCIAVFLRTLFLKPDGQRTLVAAAIYTPLLIITIFASVFPDPWSRVFIAAVLIYGFAANVTVFILEGRVTIGSWTRLLLTMIIPMSAVVSFVKHGAKVPPNLPATDEFVELLVVEGAHLATLPRFFAFVVLGLALDRVVTHKSALAQSIVAKRSAVAAVFAVAILMTSITNNPIVIVQIELLAGTLIGIIAGDWFKEQHGWLPEWQLHLAKTPLALWQKKDARLFARFPYLIRQPKTATMRVPSRHRTRRLL